MTDTSFTYESLKTYSLPMRGHVRDDGAAVTDDDPGARLVALAQEIQDQNPGKYTDHQALEAAKNTSQGRRLLRRYGEAAMVRK